MQPESTRRTPRSRSRFAAVRAAAPALLAAGVGTAVTAVAGCGDTKTNPGVPPVRSASVNSPDGARVAYLSTQTGSTYSELWGENANNANNPNATNARLVFGGRKLSAPVWSPDSARLAVIEDTTAGPPAASAAPAVPTRGRLSPVPETQLLWVVRADGAEGTDGAGGFESREAVVARRYDAFRTGLPAEAGGETGGVAGITRILGWAGADLIVFAFEAPAAPTQRYQVRRDGTGLGPYAGDPLSP